MANRNKGFEKVTAGILEGLSSNDPQDYSINPIDSIQLIDSKGTKEEKSKSVKDQQLIKKTKRSFMLTDEQIKNLYLLRVYYPSMDLSEIVGQAIIDYFNDKTRKSS